MTKSEDVVQVVVFHPRPNGVGFAKHTFDLPGEPKVGHVIRLADDDYVTVEKIGFVEDAGSFVRAAWCKIDRSFDLVDL